MYKRQVHHRVLSIAPLTGLAQARRRWLCVATRTPTPTFAWPTPLPLSRRRVLADVLLPTPKLLHCPHIHALADRPPLTRRTPRLYQRAYRRRNTQHSRIYDEFGLAPTVSTTSAVYVWHDGTQARLLQIRELARLQGLPDSFIYIQVTRGAGSSHALNRKCRTTGADARAAFVDYASRCPRHPK